MDEKNKRFNYEKCVLCKRNLNVKVDDNINDRLYYVNGAGQLCEKCYKKIYCSNKEKL